MNVQGKKREAAMGMMTQLDTWVRSWPATINDAGWDAVDSDQFNTIVNAAEQKVATQLFAR